MFLKTLIWKPLLFRALKKLSLDHLCKDSCFSLSYCLTERRQQVHFSRLQTKLIGAAGFALLKLNLTSLTATASYCIQAWNCNRITKTWKISEGPSVQFPRSGITLSMNKRGKNTAGAWAKPFPRRHTAER